MLVLVAIILGGIYAGIFTPTEAGGIGAIGALIMALSLRKLNWSDFKSSILETGKSTAMIFAIMMGVLILLRLFALSGLSGAFTNLLLGLAWPRLGILIVILLLYLFLGTFLNVTGMLMVTLPLVFPVVVGLGYDPIWFGIIAVRMCEIAFITPPVGINVYAVRAVTPDVATEDIFRGTLWFLVMDFLNLVLLIAFPAIALWLPGTMKR